MRAFLNIIVLVMRAMSAQVYHWVRISGRWVLRLIPGYSVPGGIAEAPPFPDQAVDHPVASLRRAAGRLLQAHLLEPADILGLGERQVRWLEELTRRQLCTVMTRGPMELEAHLSGRVMITGLPPVDQVSTLALIDASRQAPTPTRLESRREAVPIVEPSGKHHF